MLFLGYSAFGEITIDYRDYVQYKGTKGEPIIECIVGASNDKGAIELDTSNVSLIESDVTLNKNLSIIAAGNNEYLFRWTPCLATPHTATFEFVVSYDGEVGSRKVPPLYNFGYEIALFKSSPNDIAVSQLDFSTYDLIQIDFSVAYSSDTNVMKDSNRCWNIIPYLDSITFTQPGFSYIWTGSGMDMGGKLPRQLVQNTAYQITIIYDRPADNPFRYGYMVFHFAGDIQFKLPFTTKAYDLDTKPNLKILSPTGGERIAPCQTMLIEWEGASKDHPVIITYSVDGEKTWKMVASVSGESSSYLWTVPNEASENCFIRVSQTFQQSPAISLHYDNGRILDACFNKDGTLGLTLSDFGNLVEWDLYEDGGPVVQTNITLGGEWRSACYFNNKIVTLNTETNVLRVYNSGSSALAKEVVLKGKYTTKQLLSNTDGTILAIIPNAYESRLLFLDTNFLELIYDVNAPVTNVYFGKSNGYVYVSLLNNEVIVFDISKFPQVSEIRRYNFANDQYIANVVSVTSDERLIGLALRDFEPINTFYNRNWYADNLIYDTLTKQVFRNIQINDAAAVSLDFNKNGTLAIISYPHAPQLSIVDLTNQYAKPNTTSYLFSQQLLGCVVKDNSMLVYSYGNDNCKLINFSLPESIETELPFTIVQPKVTLSQIPVFDSLIIGTSKSYTYQKILCNSTDVPITIDTVYFKVGWFFGVNTQFPRTLEAGECMNIEVVTSPLDTGNINDTLQVVVCKNVFSFPMSYYSIDRKLTLLTNPIEYGELCVGEEDVRKVELFRNDDSVDVLINDVWLENSGSFFIDYAPRDTILHTGEIYVITLRFKPNQKSDANTRLVIKHSNQSFVFIYCPVRGVGITTTVEVSHEYLPFIPEIKKRYITLKNMDITEMFIDSVVIVPDVYKCNTTLPLYILPGAVDSIEIEYLGDSPSNATLSLIVKPCNLNKNVKMMQYSGSATLTIPNVTANPKDMNVAIPVQMRKTEIYDYAGQRFFNAEITTNPRMFTPFKIESKYDSATILYNRVEDGKRKIGVSIVGNFAKYDDELFRIIGPVALAEETECNIEFSDTSQYFGVAVDVVANNGKLLLDGLCEGRLVTRGGVTINSVFPSPVATEANVNYTILEDFGTMAKMYVVSIDGKVVISRNIDAVIGEHSITINTSDLYSGEYQIIITNENAIAKYKFRVVR